MACDKLKSSGVEALGGGVQDGYWSEWYITHSLPQQLDSFGEAVELFIGDRDFREPKYHEHWVKLEELKKNLPPDIRVETIYDRTELVDHVIRKLCTARRTSVRGSAVS